jgi:hypothetical protein
MGGCFGERKLMKKPRNRWTKLGGMLHIYSIHRPGRWPQGGHGPKQAKAPWRKKKASSFSHTSAGH